MFFITSLALISALTFYFFKQKYSYWERRGFPQYKDSKFPFGCLETVVKHKKSMGMAIYDVYCGTKEKFVGVNLLFRPALFVRDVELVRHVLVHDFSSFHDRGFYVDEENDPISATLFAQRGQNWRNMRTKLAPSFSSGKLKAMLPISEDIGDKMVAHLNSTLPENGSAEVDLKLICSNYANDIIASVIFGLDINSFENPNNKFTKAVEGIKKNTIIGAWLGIIIFLLPSFAKFFIKLGLKNPTAYALRDIIKDVIEYREKNNISRKDMLQLLIELRNSGQISEDNNFKSMSYKPGGVKSLSIEQIAAQAFIFYIAGQETVGSSAAFTIFELAQYPDLLKRAQDEARETLERCNGKITYDALNQMEFLDLCMQETLRKYPGLPMLNRECTKEFTIPGTDKVIEKGTSILISVYGMQRDPENFPDADVYDPERFLESNRNYNANAYMPFGVGPRHCIAQRMGVINTKLAVLKILANFDVETTERREIEVDNFSIVLIPKGGVKLRLSKKQNKQC